MREWPFVARQTELSIAMRALTARDRRGVVLTGPPGVGKSRLADELCDRLGRHVVRCHATAATAQLPFGALAGALPADLPPAGGNPVRHTAEHLLARTPGRLVLAVDDAHLLDDASIALLHHLARHDEATVLLTARPAADADRLAALWRTDLLVRLPVPDLTRAAVDDLLASALGGHADSGLRQRIWAHSAGNPLYVRELVTAGRSTGALAERDGIWTWSGRTELTGRLAEVVADNLGRLGGPARRALELVAYGGPLELDLLAALSSPDTVDELEAAGLVRVERSDRRAHARLGHPLYGELLRATCPTLRARAHLGALADALESVGARRREDLLRLATWRLDGDSPASAELLTAAAEHAWATRSAPLVERLVSAAVARGGGARARQLLAQVLLYRKAPDRAEAVLADATGDADGPTGAVQLASTRAYNAYFGLADLPRALAVLREADRPDLPSAERDALRFFRLCFRAHHDPVADIRAEVEAALAGADPGGWLGAGLHYLRALTEHFAGRYTASSATLDDNGERVAAVRDTEQWLQINTDSLRCGNLALGGDLARAEEVAARMIEESYDDSGPTISHSLWCAALSRCARLRGRAREAVRWAREGTSADADWPSPYDTAILAELAMSEALCGRPAEAAEALARAESAHRPAWRTHGLQVDLARPWVLACAGPVAEAADAALAAAEAARAHGAHGYEAAALHDAARFGRGTASRLAELADLLDDPMTRACAAHALGREHGDPAALEDAALRFGRLGATLFEAEALAAATRAHRGAGDERAARAAARRRAALDGAFDRATTPALRAERFTGLTPRQLEVALLAASGLTNQQIADRLHTSKRTIDNHLHAGYLALGVTGRAELRDALGVGVTDPQHPPYPRPAPVSRA
ncbi:AAA family ATPase [Saccharothrix australiensis]|uniref:ATP/maltotriose-dependent transcriptional regulator MalT n=1 Tax=Saccharothrix australiensis TaxID=2072 RepID=A0A495VWK4_9PSEU|nr:LuxR family transcriptional regulator [Saccharothrix australiensis]RKT53742.1 ATP/maltotriose-dependent transcriptional regulator MalT [Saccharothrix australiensis]